jgi:ABC-type multidrug transport system fused ATPase/permease subunit
MSHEKAQLIADLIYALVLVIGAIIFVRIVNINLTAILAGLAFWAVAARTPMSILQWLFEDWWGGIYVRMTDMFRVGHWAVVFGCDVIVIEMYRMNTLLLDFSGKLEPVLKAMHQKNSVKNLVEIDDVDLDQIITTANGERIEIEDEDNGEEDDDDEEEEV